MVYMTVPQLAVVSGPARTLHGDRQRIRTTIKVSQELSVDEISSELLLQLSVDELAEVLEEFLGIEFSDSQVSGMRQLLQTAGSLQGALELLEKLGPAAEAA
jgi:hypothetical protein